MNSVDAQYFDSHFPTAEAAWQRPCHRNLHHILSKHLRYSSSHGSLEVKITKYRYISLTGIHFFILCTLTHCVWLLCLTCVLIHTEI